MRRVCAGKRGGDKGKGQRLKAEGRGQNAEAGRQAWRRIFLEPCLRVCYFFPQMNTVLPPLKRRPIFDAMKSAYSLANLFCATVLTFHLATGTGHAAGAVVA